MEEKEIGSNLGVGYSRMKDKSHKLSKSQRSQNSWNHYRKKNEIKGKSMSYSIIENAVKRNHWLNLLYMYFCSSFSKTSHKTGKKCITF